MLSRKTFTIGIILIAVLGISACIETNHEVEAPAAVTSANEPADANNQVGATPVADTSSDERSPVWSPDSSKIFFKSDDWICVCNPDGSQKEKLAEIKWNSLVMDPERKRAFYKNRTCTVDGSEETYQAYVMDIDGKNLTKIASLTLEDEYVDDGGYIGGTRMLAYDMHSWSPNRTEIFFTRLEETGYTWVWREEEGEWVRYRAGTEPFISVLDERGWEGQKLIAKEHLKTAWVWDLEENELRFIGNLSYGIVHGTLRGLVVWSPDGRHVALPCSDLSEAGSTGQIFVINMETGKSRRSTSFVGSSTLPRWSPDGKKIMYVRMPPKYWWSPYIDNSDEGADIWVVDIDGSNEKQVTAIPENWEEGFWSPDGKRIVYASLKPGFMDVGETREIEVRMVNEDGGDERLLTTITTELIVRMVWSPDGSKIAVVTWEYEEGVNRDIYMIDIPATEDVKNDI
ncbi:MAG: hypothetical protein K8R25_01975 [Methanosarcinales archaeon]|nr:hypothetical protein [Methanosarcinales archaeon]